MQQVKKLIPRREETQVVPQPAPVNFATPIVKNETALITELREWMAIFGGADGEEMSIISRLIRLLVELLSAPPGTISANELMGELDILNEELNKAPLNVCTYTDLAELKNRVIQLEATAAQVQEKTTTLSTLENELAKSHQEVERLLASLMEHKTARNKLAELGLRGMTELDAICRKFLTESDRQIYRLQEQTKARERATVQLNKAIGCLIEVDAVNGSAQEVETRIRSLQNLIVGQAKPSQSTQPEPAQSTPAQQLENTMQDQNLEAVTLEIERISAWRDSLIEKNAQYCEDRTAVADEIQELKGELAFAEGRRKSELSKQLASLEAEARSLESLISELVKLESHQSITVTLRTLDRYKKAVETVSSGVPMDLFNQELPAIPEIVEVSTYSETTPPPSKPRIDIEAILATMDPKEVAERRKGLSLLAKACKVSASELLIYTLYEALPCNHRGMRQRSIQTVVDHALRAGISPAFGFQNSTKLLEAWHNREKENHKYLTFQGKPPAGGPVFRRSSVPLPWKVEQILTPEEVAAFQLSLLSM